MDEAQVIALFESCSNVGRWGDDDELGTLNFITAERRLAALALPRSGRVVSLGFDLEVGTSREDPPSAQLAVRYEPDDHSDSPLYVLDTMTVDAHGYEATHVDAPSHVYFDGRAAFGRRVSDIAGPDRLEFGSIQPMGEQGIVTRGVLLDVAATKGVDFLAPNEGISRADVYICNIVKCRRGCRGSHRVARGTR